MVVSVEADDAAPVLQVCGGLYTVEVPLSVFESVDGGVGLHLTAAIENIGAVAVGMDVCREGVEGVFGQEVMKVQVVDADVCIISHCLCVEVAFGILGYDSTDLCFYEPFAFTGIEVGIVSRAVGFQSAVEGDA